MILKLDTNRERTRQGKDRTKSVAWPPGRQTQHCSDHRLEIRDLPF